MNIDFRKTKLFLSFKLRRILKILSFIFDYLRNFCTKLVRAYKILSIWEKRILIIFSIIFLIALGFLVRKIYYQNTVSGPVPGGKITIAEVGEPGSLNPIFAKTSQDQDLTNLLFSGMFYFNEKGELMPDLISSYEVAPDNKTYTFKIINAEWHDGVKVTTDDFIFTASLIADENYNGPLKGLFSNVILERVDDSTFKIILAEPYAPFLSHLTFGILPSHLLANVPLQEIEKSDFNTSPIGSGPYKFKSSNLTGKTKQITLERNNHYPNKKRIPFINDICFQYYSDFGKAFKAYRNGEVSFLADVPHQYFQDAKRIKDLNLYKITSSNYLALFFNLAQQPLKNRAVREAIARGINKKEIIDNAFSGQGEDLVGPILPEFIGYTNEVKIYSYDLQTAKNLLEKAGYPKLELNLVTSDSPDYLKVAEIISNQLSQIGIKINISSFDTLTLQTDYIAPRKYDLLLLGENLGPDPDPYAYWHSSQIGSNKFNFSQFSNKDVDKLIETARITNDNNLRKTNYERFQKIITEELPAIFLFRPLYYFGLNSSIKGASDIRTISTADKFYQVNRWYLKIGRTKK